MFFQAMRLSALAAGLLLLQGCMAASKSDSEVLNNGRGRHAARPQQPQPQPQPQPQAQGTKLAVGPGVGYTALETCTSLQQFVPGFVADPDVTLQCRIQMEFLLNGSYSAKIKKAGARQFFESTGTYEVSTTEPNLVIFNNRDGSTTGHLSEDGLELDLILGWDVVAGQLDLFVSNRPVPNTKLAVGPGVGYTALERCTSLQQFVPGFVADADVTMLCRIEVVFLRNGSYSAKIAKAGARQFFEGTGTYQVSTTEPNLVIFNNRDDTTTGHLSDDGLQLDFILGWDVIAGQLELFVEHYFDYSELLP